MRRLLMIGLLVLMPQTASAYTWYITPDGTGDAPTIHAGLDSASAGDTVLVACGTYYEHGVHMKSGVALLSVTGDPDCVTIDAERNGTCIWCRFCDHSTVVEGITITGGMTRYHIGYGGGVWCEASAMTFRNCVFTKNSADAGGGMACMGGAPRFERCTFSENQAAEGAGALCSYSSPTFDGCLFLKNWAHYKGGGIWCEVQSVPLVSGCTFYRNAGDWGGGGIACYEESSPMLRNTIIAFSSQGDAISREHDDCNPLLFCCNLYGNAGGNWADFILDQWGHQGNFQADPRFCDIANDDFTLAEDSPCLPGNHPGGYVCGDVVGCYGQGCIIAKKTEPTTWGAIKSIYR